MSISMDPELKEAACLGDVAFLKRAVASNKPSEYFLSQFMPSVVLEDEKHCIKYNFFHFAVHHSKEEFFRKAMEILPRELIQQLLSQNDECTWNPFHVAASVCKSPEIVRLIYGFYKSDSLSKPWLAVSVSKQTPLHIALKVEYDEIRQETAMEIMSVDMEVICGMLDNKENSPLFLAVQNGYSRVAKKILKSSCSYSLSGQLGSTPLHFAPKCSSDKVLRLLLKNHPDLIKAVDNEGCTVLHQWAKIAEVQPLKILAEGKFSAATTKVFRELIHMKDEKEGDTPLHIAARSQNSNFVEALILGYQQETKAGESLDFPPPWRTKNKDGNTPLHISLSLKPDEQLALYFLSLDSTLCEILNNKGESPLLLAVASGFEQVIKEILRIHPDPCYSMLLRDDGVTVLHLLPVCSEEIGRRLLGKFWWINKLLDNTNRTALDKAKEANVSWLVDLLMNPSLIQKESFDWIKACKNDNSHAVLAFINNCQDLQKVCREHKDTPLHHMKLQTYREYLEFLHIPSIAKLKNTTDSQGATPLHRALERQDLFLAKALLDDNGVKRNKKDKRGKTAMDLLAQLSKENDEWEKMLKVYSSLKTIYINHDTNLDQMRNALTIVAALLATITFAAGFTLPGGLDDKTGDAILAKKATFLVFILADAYAMCTSMLVLFCLIWSMVSSHDTSYLLVDRSVRILMQSLYGTLLTFMTGTFTVIAHGSLWAAIIIIIMCSIIGISASRTVLQTLVSFIPTSIDTDQNTVPKDVELGKPRGFQEKAFTSDVSDQKDEKSSSNLLRYSTSTVRQKLITAGDQDEILLLEEGKAYNSRNDDSQNDEGTRKSLENASIYVKKKMLMITAGNEDQKDRYALLEQGKAFNSGRDDSQNQNDEGTSSKSLENSSLNVMKKILMITAGNEDHKDRFPLLEQGKASTSGNDESQQAE